MGHGLGAALLAASIVTPSGWIQTPAGYPHNYLENLLLTYSPVHSKGNPGPGTMNYQASGYHYVAQSISGSSLEGPPTESGPTWNAKFTPLTGTQLQTAWTVDWDVPAGWTYHVIMDYSHEVGTETWFKGATGAVRHRSWHTFAGQRLGQEGPGGGEPGGGG
ncbi:MAG: hypothetical protein AB7F50_12120 [Fimbriimonadaceae bacterium]